MVVENRLCCLRLLMSYLQAANEDRDKFCCSCVTQFAIVGLPKVGLLNIRVCVGTIVCTMVFYVYGQQQKKEFFRCLHFAVIISIETGRQKHVCLNRPINVRITRFVRFCFSLGFQAKTFWRLKLVCFPLPCLLFIKQFESEFESFQNMKDCLLNGMP